MSKFKTYHKRELGARREEESDFDGERRGMLREIEPMSESFCFVVEESSEVF